MKIREGAYYRTQGGDVVGPMRRVDWCDATFTAGDFTWNEDGSYVQGIPYKMDFISEVYVSDTPLADVLPSDGSVNFENCFITTSAPAPEAKTLRDEIAMQLMKPNDFMVGFKEHAEQLYRAADAMLILADVSGVTLAVMGLEDTAENMSQLSEFMAASFIPKGIN